MLSLCASRPRPTILATDLVQTPDLIEVVAELDEVTDEP